MRSYCLSLFINALCYFRCNIHISICANLSLLPLKNSLSLFITDDVTLGSLSSEREHGARLYSAPCLSESMVIVSNCIDILRNQAIVTASVYPNHSLIVLSGEIIPL